MLLGGASGHEGKRAGAAKNPIAAAIGVADQAGAAFTQGMMKNDNIAAAIVLRGLAKGGKFAADGADTAKSAKSVVGGKNGDTVAGVVQEVSKWLEEMMGAAAKAAAVADTGDGKIADVANNGAGAKADDESVKGIALGIKGIVEAAGKASGQDGDALKGVTGAAGNSNASAGKLFDTNNGGKANATDVRKAADAVGAVSGKQIIKAIVDAAGGKFKIDFTNLGISFYSILLLLNN